MNRGYLIKNRDGSGGYRIPGSLIFEGWPFDNQHQTWQAVRRPGTQFQQSHPGSRQTGFKGILYGDDHSALVNEVGAIFAAFGTTDKRLYLNDDRYAIVRLLEINANTLSADRECAIQLEVKLLVMDSRFFDDEGESYSEA